MEEKYIQMITEAMDSAKSAHKRIDAMEHNFEKTDQKMETIYDLTVSVKEIALETKAMREDVNKIETRVNEIEEKPSKRYEGIVTNIISCIVTAVVTYFLIKMGVK